MNEVFRQEKKYWMIQIDMQILSGRLEKVMLQDPHNGAQGYTIRSLYFDTLGETDYQGKIDGLELRRKIMRLRCISSFTWMPTVPVLWAQRPSPGGITPREDC